MTEPLSARKMPLANNKSSLPPLPGSTQRLGILKKLALSWRRWATYVDWPKVGIGFSVLFIVGAWVVLYRLIQHIQWSEIDTAIGRISTAQGLLAFVATILSYAALVCYDALALHQVGARHISFKFTAFTSFIAQAFTFTLGFSLLTGGFIRLRLYQTRGLQPSRIIAIGLLCTATFWLGLTAAGGLSLLFAPSFVSSLDHLSSGLNFFIGLMAFLALALWLYYVARKNRTVLIGSWDLPLPGIQATVLSILTGLADTLAASAALWLLIPGDTSISYPAFVLVFIAATLLGVISNAPGGLGVFEAVILLAFREVPQAELLASLVLFRVIYYLIPFSIAVTLFVAHEVRTGSRAVIKTIEIAQMVKPFVPALTSAAVFFQGFVLLISGTLPALEERMAVLRRTIPLPFVETSHFLASIVGAMLLVVAHGLLQRVKSAWFTAITLLGAAAVFSLMKGFDYEETFLSLLVIALLWFGRKEFYRKGGLLDSDLSTEWVFAALCVAFATIWIGSVIYHNVHYDRHLWWDFTYRGDAPRFLRATLGIFLVFLTILSYRLLHKSSGLEQPASPQEIKRAMPLILASRRAEANLAFLGDKRLLFNNAGTGFIMYAVKGRTWVAMGDPIVPEGESVSELVWQFRELVDQHRGLPVFYQANTHCLPAYLDAGLSMAKLGEEAWIDLSKFTLEGKEGRRLRQTKAAAERSEATVEIVPAREVGALLPQIKPVSDAWLDNRGISEKGFSLGFWHEAYLRRYDFAVVRHFDEIVAFANLWRSADKYEFSVDVMRYSPEAPPGVMDLLFINLMEHAAAEGYLWFNLGMAPLSGLPEHRLASLWSRFGTFLFRHGARYYNFSGLRAFKSKFKPEWRPRYLAYPGGTLPKVLVDVTALIARSPSRVHKAGNDLT